MGLERQASPRLRARQQGYLMARRKHRETVVRVRRGEGRTAMMEARCTMPPSTRPTVST